MCLAILKPEGKTIPRETLEAGYTSNSDGAGFAYAEDGKVVIVKGFFKFDDFYAAYQPHENKTCLIHFRIKTAGNRDGFNCHPWQINDSMALIHNGMLRIKDEGGVSDTGIFTNKVIAPIIASNPSIVFHGGFKWMVEEAIGSGNKVVILNGENKYVIFNESAGNWDDGVWYSNCSHKYSRKIKHWTQDDSDFFHGSGAFAGESRYTYHRSNPTHAAASSGSASNSSVRADGPKSWTRWRETSIPNVFMLTVEFRDRMPDKIASEYEKAEAEAKEQLGI